MKDSMIVQCQAQSGSKGIKEKGRKGKTSGRDGRSKSEGLPKTDVAVSAPSRLIASGPVPCQALTSLSSAVIYRLRLARFKHQSVAIMA